MGLVRMYDMVDGDVRVTKQKKRCVKTRGRLEVSWREITVFQSVTTGLFMLAGSAQLRQCTNLVVYHTSVPC